MEAKQARANRCGQAVAAYSDDLLESNLIDLLADAMHWCDFNGLDFHILLMRAGSHYLAELRQPSPGRSEP